MAQERAGASVAGKTRCPWARGPLVQDSVEFADGH